MTVMTTTQSQENIMFEILLILSIASLLARVLKITIFDTSKQEAVIADEWNAFKTKRSSRN